MIAIKDCKYCGAPVASSIGKSYSCTTCRHHNIEDKNGNVVKLEKMDSDETD